MRRGNEALACVAEKESDGNRRVAMYCYMPVAFATCVVCEVELPGFIRISNFAVRISNKVVKPSVD